MKKTVKSAELKGNNLQQYINNVRKEVERDLNSDVNSIDWDMDNNTVYLTVEFKNGVSEAFPFEAWRFTGEPAYFDYDVDIIVDTVRNYMKSEEMEGYEYPRYKFIKSKSVLDSDGFYTDYTMYYDTESDQYIYSSSVIMIYMILQLVIGTGLVKVNVKLMSGLIATMDLLMMMPG